MSTLGVRTVELSEEEKIDYDVSTTFSSVSRFHEKREEDQAFFKDTLGVFEDTEESGEVEEILDHAEEYLESKSRRAGYQRNEVKRFEDKCEFSDSIVSEDGSLQIVARELPYLEGHKTRIEVVTERPSTHHDPDYMKNLAEDLHQEMNEKYIELTEPEENSFLEKASEYVHSKIDQLTQC